MRIAPVFIVLGVLAALGHLTEGLGGGILAGRALAAEEKSKDKGAKGGKEGKDAKDGGQFVNISPVAAPIVVNGRLINYVFVTIRLDLAPSGDPIRLRDKEPYFRDALVRAAHRRPFVKPGDYTHVDEAALIRTMMGEAQKIAGPGQIAKIEILAAQPRRVLGLPAPPDAQPAERPPVP